MSSAAIGSESESGDIPCPREVWRAAVEDRRISIRVQPERGSPVEFEGVITSRRKAGHIAYCHVTIQFVPDGELAPLEIESSKERGEWGPFRAFHWTQPPRPEGPDDHVFQYIGRVDRLDLEGVRSDGERARDTGASEGVA